MRQELWEAKERRRGLVEDHRNVLPGNRTRSSGIGAKEADRVRRNVRALSTRKLSLLLAITSLALACSSGPSLSDTRLLVVHTVDFSGSQPSLVEMVGAISHSYILDLDDVALVDYYHYSNLSELVDTWPLNDLAGETFDRIASGSRGNIHIHTNERSSNSLTASGHAGFSSQMTIRTGFVSGVNTLEVVTADGAGSTGNLTGLRIEFEDLELRANGLQRRQFSSILPVRFSGSTGGCLKAHLREVSDKALPVAPLVLTNPGVNPNNMSMRKGPARVVVHTHSGSDGVDLRIEHVVGSDRSIRETLKQLRMSLRQTNWKNGIDFTPGTPIARVVGTKGECEITVEQ